MEIPNQEPDMPIPLNTTYHHHLIHHDPTSSQIIVPSSDEHVINNNSFKKTTVKYKECLKNHAAAMGGNATDGCGEFMPSGEEGSLEALTCSACNCHRNFHRKEIEGFPNFHENYCYPNINSSRFGRKFFVGHNALITSRPMLMSYNNMGGGNLASESEEEVGVRNLPNHHVKKRFRTKFSQEQKEKMQSFAEKVGWKIQKQEESVVQQFCQEIGVKRRVLKVWMHNNKHSLQAKKNNGTNDAGNNDQV